VNESDGLDLYIDFNVINTGTTTGPISPNTGSPLTAGDIINVVYAFKKKSSAACS
jgi:hypothetical protein